MPQGSALRGIRRSFGRQRGRPAAGALSEQDIPEAPRVAPADEGHERQLALDEFRYFLFEVMKYPDLNPRIHGALADFMGRTRGERPTTAGRGLYHTSAELALGIPNPVPERSENRPYGVDLDGSFRGLFWEHRGDGADKLVLVPRNHLKSTVISVAYVLWRIAKNPAIRVLIANAVLGNSRKFLKAIKWQLRHNDRLHRLFPNLKIDSDAILKHTLTWAVDQFSVPREVTYEAGENTVESAGVGGNLASRHYDIVIGDDLVNNRNVRNTTGIETVRQWFEDAHSLLEPETGEVVLVGTRWDYNDLYSTALNEFADTYSLFFMTVVGTDEEVFFPEKFSKSIVEKLRKKHGTYKFSCQYMNQPTDHERADFKPKWIQWYDLGEDKKGRSILPDGHAWETFATLDPAITEDDGDASSFNVVSINELDDWYVRETIDLHVGDVGAIVETMFRIQERYPELAVFGVETRGWQKTIAKGAKDLMKRRGIYINVKELKKESGSSKKGRIMRLIPRFEARKVFLRGKTVEAPHECAKSLVAEYTRFPRGKDDDLDSLAYIYDICFTPQAVKQEKPMSVHDRIMRRVKGARRGKIEVSDDHMGSEF